MASGKISPRQKMINLMYLVFIAMLAMNMDKEVLSAFGLLTEELKVSNTSTSAKNDAAYEGLNTLAQEQAAKYLPLKEKADKIKSLSSDFYSYLEDLKSKMTEGIEDLTDYTAMDKPDFLDEYFFRGDGLKPEGQEFVDKMNNFRTEVIAALGGDFKDLEKIVGDRFNTDPIKNDDEKMIDWLDYRYKGYPLVASLTNLTQIQANIINTESDVLSTLLQGELKSQVSLSNYKGIPALDKTAYFSGERVTGKIVLGRYDATMVPDKVTLNGRAYTNIKDGQVIIDMPAGNVGPHDIKGVISFTENGETVDVPFETTYSVIPEPNSAVVSADKMNVVYRGLDNPISVSLPGVGANNLKVSATGGTLTGSGGKFIARPGSANNLTVNVSARLSSGKTVTSAKTFRIKDIPPAMGTVRNQFGTVRMPKSGLSNTPIGAALPDFAFDLKLRVTSFKVKVPGQLTIIVNGTSLNAKAKRALAKARRGDIINIYDIKAVVSNNASYKLKKVLPVNIELTN